MENKDKMILEQQKKIADQAIIISALEQEVALLKYENEQLLKAKKKM